MRMLIAVLALVVMPCSSFRKMALDLESKGASVDYCNCPVASQRVGCAGKSHAGDAMVEQLATLAEDIQLTTNASELEEGPSCRKFCGTPLGCPDGMRCKSTWTDYRQDCGGGCGECKCIGAPPSTSFQGPASEKMTNIWKKITADTRSHGFVGLPTTGVAGIDKAYVAHMGEKGLGPGADEWPGRNPHEKITHGIAGHAKAHFEWCNNNPYTGMFQKADECIIRIANALEPVTSKDSLLGALNPTTYNPNMGIKCFRDGEADSANLEMIWEIDGYNVLPEGLKNSCSYFEKPYANHCGRRDDINFGAKDIFIPSFERLDDRAMWLGVSQFAEADQAGNRENKPNFPFALILQPHPDLNKIPCKFHDVMSQLHNIDASWVGRDIFSIYAVHDPWMSRPSGSPEPVRIGTMKLDSQFTTSYYADTKLFFRHTFFHKELDKLEEVDSGRAAKWKRYSSNFENYKADGAYWYEPFLPKTFETCQAAYALVASNHYCSNRGGVGGNNKFSKNVGADNLEACYKYVSSVGECGPFFDYGTTDGWCDCVKATDSNCIQAHSGAYAVYKKGEVYTEADVTKENSASGWKMWGTHGCQQMEDGWNVCTNDADINHLTVMNNCPATCAKARGATSFQAGL